MHTSSRDYLDVPLLVSCTNDGGLVLLLQGKSLVLDCRDHTGLTWRAGRHARAIVAPPHCHLEWRYDEGAPRHLTFDDACDIHDVIWHGDKLYAVATGSNEVLCLDPEGGIQQRLHFPGEGDAWHLNCLAVWNGRVVVSAFGDFSTHRGYKGATRSAGIVFDLASNEKLWSGLSQPHSPLQDGNTLYVCDSESHRVLWRRGNEEGALQFDAYTRGLAVHEEWLFVGLSQSRNTGYTGSNGAIVVLERESHRQVATLPIPFREIYVITTVTESEWPSLLALSIAERDSLRDQLSQCQIALHRAETASAALDRLQRHPLVGRLIGLLRRLKRDPDFGRAAD